MRDSRSQKASRLPFFSFELHPLNEVGGFPAPRLRRKSAGSIPYRCRRGRVFPRQGRRRETLSMHRRALLALAASSLASLTICPAHADDYRVTGPVIHENLAIYLVHGKSASGPVPLTLEEALAKRTVKVHETGNVNELQIENLGTGEVFVQSGVIVKGGQQDRVLSVSLVLPPKSGRINIASFCVEQGRWTARGREDVKTFATASSAIPSREAKIAIRSQAVAPPIAAFVEPTAQINPLSSLSPEEL